MKHLLLLFTLASFQVSAAGVYQSAMFDETSVNRSYPLNEFSFEVEDTYFSISSFLNVFYKGKQVAIQSTVGAEGVSTAKRYKNYIEKLKRKYPKARVLFETKKVRRNRYPEVVQFRIILN